ncbi:MAG: beta-galactosidase [Pirellulales bacterium]
MKYCIEAPDARAVVEKFLRALMPMIVNHPALHSICLSNEPQYSGKCAYARIGFRKWLQQKHATIEALNEVYGTDFHAFQDVPIPDDRSSYGLFFDWCGYNQDRLLEFHQFERRIIRQYDADLRRRPARALVARKGSVAARLLVLGLVRTTT